MKKRNQGSKQMHKNTAEVQISHILHQARLKKNYSLDDLYKFTKIKPQYLKDIENGNFDDLPGGFYIRAFIKKYADSVGVDGHELLRRYNNKLPDLKNPQYMNNVSEDKLLVNAERQRIQNRHSTVRKYIPLVSLIVVVILVLVGIWVASSHYHNSLSTDFGEHSTTMSGVSSSEPVHKKARRNKRSKVKSRLQIVIHDGEVVNNQLHYRVTTHNRPMNLKLMSAQPVQVSLKLDSRNESQMTLKAKQLKTIKVPAGTKQLQVNVNNSSGIKAKLNDKVIKLNRDQLIRSFVFKFSK